MLVLTTHNEICGVMDWILIMLNGNGFPEFLTDLLGREKCKKKSNRSQQRRAKTLKHVKEPDKKLAWLPH
jgi:hypothetical protein